MHNLRIVYVAIQEPSGLRYDLGNVESPFHVKGVLEVFHKIQLKATLKAVGFIVIAIRPLETSVWVFTI